MIDRAPTMVSLNSRRLLFCPFHTQINCLFETSLARDESVVSTAAVAVIPSQFKVTQQISLYYGWR
jgi:hypothetical protein